MPAAAATTPPKDAAVAHEVSPLRASGETPAEAGRAAAADTHAKDVLLERATGGEQSDHPTHTTQKRGRE